ncbi:YidB family protein [Pseudoduganella violaceinigra]|uniref:YidB family protein n=1 Tax=Pseudoduganella violaceinigra TaxID=246602 RepID=UPI0003FED09E|nr:YidB family protein [Pseudoduganella violaceinigra]
MGILDSLAGEVMSQFSGGNHPEGMLEAVSTMLNDPRTGGLQGLVASFEQGGMGGVIASWIGTGQNQPISADQLQSVLGSEQVQAIASRLGLNSQEVSGHLAQLLPQIVDKLTPGGTIPDSGGGLGAALGGLFGRS